MVVASALGAILAFAVPASAGVLFSQDFETDTSGILAGGDYGSVSRVTGPLTPFQGSAYGVVTETGWGPYTYFGDPNHSAPPTLTGANPFTVSVATYLDTSWQTGSGFDWDVSANSVGGGFLRDFIFHIFAKDGAIIVGGSNNAALNDNNNYNLGEKPTDTSGGNHYTVNQSGWYVLQSVFYDAAGTLAVDLNLRDASNALLFTQTLSNASDAFSGVYAGERYGWFNDVSIANGLSVDALSLSTADVPEPATIALLGVGLIGVGFARSRRRT